jgi:ATP-dependent RNA helicase DeaD
MGLPEALMHTLEHMQFTNPTPIQAESIPLALEGKDILGSAQTGTGKTGAFGIPLIARLMNQNNGVALVMTPTRELASQVMVQLQAMLGRKSKIKTALLIGGEAMPKQLMQLRKHPRVIVGTPGRINDHLERGTLNLNEADFLVLDETDRMLDMGFSVQIESIIKHMAPIRQTLLFSATLPKNIVHIADQYLQDPVRVSVSATSSPAEKIHQTVLKVNDSEKYPELLNQLNERQGSIIVFVKTKYGSEKMAKKLSQEGYSADAIHGDLRQHKRDRVIRAFRQKKYRILVATDVAARGLDIPHIEHVVNYDLPQCAEDYIHRIGRTARAGAEGEALNLVTPADRNRWYAIDRLLNPKAKRPMATKSDKKTSRFKGRREDSDFQGKRKSGFGFKSKRDDSGFGFRSRKEDSNFQRKGKDEPGFKGRRGDGEFKARREDSGFQGKRKEVSGFKSRREEGGFKAKREDSSFQRKRKEGPSFKFKRDEPVSKGKRKDFGSKARRDDAGSFQNKKRHKKQVASAE